MNGVWPARQFRYSKMVTELIDMISEWPQLNIEPRQRHAPWVRHVLRRFNTTANDLATRGKHLTHDIIIQFNESQLTDVEYVKGLWDGGHDPGSSEVGIGFELRGYSRRPLHSQEGYTTIALAHGKCEGFSSADAEICAFQTMIHVVHRKLNRWQQWPTLPAWRPKEAVSCLSGCTQ